MGFHLDVCMRRWSEGLIWYMEEEAWDSWVSFLRLFIMEAAMSWGIFLLLLFFCFIFFTSFMCRFQPTLYTSYTCESSKDS